MGRSKWKVLFHDENLFNSFLLPESTDSNNPLTIKSRRSGIPSSMSGFFVKIHNGFTYITRRVTKTMIGKKFGEFSLTRKPHIYKKKGKKVKSKKK